MTGGVVDYKHLIGTWRNKIFDKDGEFLFYNGSTINPTIPTEFKKETEINVGDITFRYIAPYPTNNGGHGLNYGENTHGAFSVLSKEEIFAECKEGIKNSDIVFAWIDEPTAYGTLYELGICYSLCKPVFMAMPIDFENYEEHRVHPKDFWFASMGADQFVYTNNVKQAWDLFTKIALSLIADNKKPTDGNQ